MKTKDQLPPLLLNDNPYYATTQKNVLKVVPVKPVNITVKSR